MKLFVYRQCSQIKVKVNFLFLLIVISANLFSQNKEKVSFSKEKIPFEVTAFNNIKVNAILNGKHTIPLTFDTGSIDFYLTKAAIKKHLNPNNLKLTMKDISDNTFRIGNIQWHNQQIYPIETTGQETDGMFGWNMFAGNVLEINFDKNQITVRPKLPRISKKYEKFEMEVLEEHLLINLEIQQGDQRYKSKFLFDTGFQKSLMLDNDLLTKINFPTEEMKVLKTSVLYNSNNEAIPLKTVDVQKLIVGKYVLQHIPSELNTYNKPAGYEVNFLGNEIIKRFNMILDFQNHIIYLKPNKKFK